jgi:glyoxylase-like metal-dependent hydrolase (beta-lactamase superfamily II)
MEPNDLVLSVESHRALVAGDTLQDRGNGMQFLGELANNVPAERGVAAEQILENMQPLLALPVEIVPLTHGSPDDRAALERALATPAGRSRSASD